MKKLFKIHIHIAFLLFFLGGCSWLNHQISPEFPDSGDFINRFKYNKQGIVFFKFHSRYPSTLWCKYSEYDDFLKDDCLEIKPSNYYQILMAKPGIYEVRQYDKTTRLHDTNNFNVKISEKTNKRTTKPIMAFEVKQDKISFLGEIDFRSSKPISQNNYDKDFDEIKQSLLNKNPKELKAIFKGHKYEIAVLNTVFRGDKDEIKEYLIKDKIKTSQDFSIPKKKSSPTNKINKSRLKSKYGY